MAADQRAKLERLARYVSRPPVSIERLALTGQGQVRYRLKTPSRDGSTHIVLEPLDFMARLAALVPTPRHVALTWAARLKRVFAIEIEQCARGGGPLKVIASIEEPERIERILTHRRERGAEASVSSLGPRAPPQSSLL